MDRHTPLPAAPLQGEVVIAALPPQGRLIFRGREPAIAAMAAPLGFGLPREICRAAERNGRAALWLGPDEWLILAPEPDIAALFAACEAATSAHPHALTDISHRQAAIAVSGAAASLVLNAGCPLDLRDAAFPVGMCTRTVLAKAEITLWRTGPDAFRVEVWRSFADYAWRFLEEVSREFRV